MKKRFLTTGGRDDYYDIPYVRSHRNLTRDALDSLEDENSNPIDYLPSKVTCRSKHKWDDRYVSNAGKRWLHSNVGKVWDKIRQDYINYTAGKGFDYLVETTTIIDGVLHIVDTFGPAHLMKYGEILSMWMNMVSLNTFPKRLIVRILLLLCFLSMITLFGSVVVRLSSLMFP